MITTINGFSSLQETQFLWFWVRFQNLLWLQLRRQGWPHNFPRRTCHESHAWISWKSYAKSTRAGQNRATSWMRKHEKDGKNASVPSVNRKPASLSVSCALPSHSSHSAFSSGSRGRSGKLEGASCRKIVQTLVPHGTVGRFCHSPHSIKCSNKFHTWVQSSCARWHSTPMVFTLDSWFCTAGKTL